MAGVSPLAPATVPRLDPVPGVRLATASAGIKYRDRTDVLVAVLDPGTAVAGVLTRSKCPSAPVDWCREHLRGGKARVLVVNSGNANAFTGARGRAGTKKIAALAGKAASCPAAQVFLASTGVIGEPLDPSKFAGVVAAAAIGASVTTKASRVAMSGAIMPAPLAMPLMLIETPSISTLRVASLG